MTFGHFMSCVSSLSHYTNFAHSDPCSGKNGSRMHVRLDSLDSSHILNKSLFLGRFHLWSRHKGGSACRHSYTEKYWAFSGRYGNHSTGSQSRRRKAVVLEQGSSIPFIHNIPDTISKVSKAEDMIVMAKHMLQVEQGWLLSQIGTPYLAFVVLVLIECKGLIPDCDDDVMDEVYLNSVLRCGLP